MGYKIDLDELSKILDGLVAFDEKAYQEDFRQLSLLFNGLKSNFENFRVTEFKLEDNLSRNYNISELLRVFYRYYRNFYKISQKFSTFDIADYVKLSLSDKDCLDLVRSFFAEQGDFFAKPLELFYKQINSHISFIKPNENTSGQMVYLSSIKQAFVVIPNSESIEKVLTTVHEFEHVIDAYNNPLFHQAEIVRESTAVFFEMIAADRINDMLNTGIENLKRRYLIDNIISNDIDYVYYNFQLLHHYGLFKGKKEDLYAYLNTKGFNEYAIEQLSFLSLSLQSYYLISYMIAVEIYVLYGKDKELALFIIKQIVMEANSDNIIEVLDKYGIHLNENMYNYKKDLENELIKKNVIEWSY